MKEGKEGRKEEGRKDGRKEGRTDGRTEGRKDGRTDRRTEGRKEGRKEGGLGIRSISKLNEASNLKLCWDLLKTLKNNGQVFLEVEF